MADGLATMLAGLGGGSGTTTYAENIGVMAATKVYSTSAYYVAAIVAIAFGCIPKFGALISTLPAGVLGGAGTILYGLIAVLGGRIWVENRVNFYNPVNLIPVCDRPRRRRRELHAHLRPRQRVVQRHRDGRLWRHHRLPADALALQVRRFPRRAAVAVRQCRAHRPAGGRPGRRGDGAAHRRLAPALFR